jgi:Leucine-rich repeat (LRR) protein
MRSLKKLRIVRALQVDSNFLENLPNLLHVSLDLITRFEITIKTFSKQRDLQELVIQRCHVSSLPENVFVNLNNLTHLSMFRNDLRTLNENSFNGLGNLRELHFDCNPLIEFDTSILLKMAVVGWEKYS